MAEVCYVLIMWTFAIQSFIWRWIIFQPFFPKKCCFYEITCQIKVFCALGAQALAERPMMSFISEFIGLHVPPPTKYKLLKSKVSSSWHSWLIPIYFSVSILNSICDHNTSLHTCCTKDVQHHWQHVFLWAKYSDKKMFACSVLTFSQGICVGCRLQIVKWL